MTTDPLRVATVQTGWEGKIIHAATDVEMAERDAARAVDLTVAEDGDALQRLADWIASVQDLIRQARTLEGYLTMRMGKAIQGTDAERLGNLPDGRQWRLHRTADRKAWDHDAWRRDARKVVTEQVTDDLAEGDSDGRDLAVLNTADGSVVGALGPVLQQAMTDLQEFHGAAAPKVGTLKRHDLDPGDYCEPVRGNWKLDTIAPSQNHDQQED